MAGEIVNPFANYVQLAGKSHVALLARFINTHTMVGTLGGTQSWFTPAGRSYSHYGTGGSGEARQWQDLRYRAASDLQGNPWSISYENEDRGDYFPAWSGGNVPPFTDAQAEKLIVMQAWDCVRFNIPPLIVPNSLPTPNGLSWHRKGIDPWRVSGGLRYSSSDGKLCPGDERIEQYIEEIVPGIQALVLGETLGGVMTEEQYQALVLDIRREVSLAVHHIVTGGTNSVYHPERPIEGQDFSWVGSDREWTLPKIRESLIRNGADQVRSLGHYLATGKSNTMFNKKTGRDNRTGFGLDYSWMNEAVDLKKLMTEVQS